jgi:uncharacterized membrane protein YraQ (UPF0718 family)/copper chaperone CopZ
VQNLLYTGVQEFWGTLLDMSPYLLLGFAVAGLLSILVKAEQVERHLGRRGFLSILKASVFGIPLPLCSCGVIPVAASLRKHGAGKGAVASFLLSTPQTGVDSIMVTYSLMGPLFAIFRPLAALLSGIVGGSLVELAGGKDDSHTEIELCTDDCCVPAAVNRHWLQRAFSYGFMTLPRDIGKSMLIGLVLAGVIAVAVPDDFFTQFVGTGLLGMVFMMLVGIPVYVCATASVPIAVVMMAKGITPGAALVFLITGPATNAAAITTLWKVLGRRSALAYMASVALVALGSGLALDYLFTVVPLGAEHVPHHMLPQGVKVCTGIILAVVLGQAFFKPHHSHAAHEQSGREFAVKGMKCSHCAQTVTRIIRVLEGVDEASVSLDTGTATVKGTAPCADIIKAIESVGYGAEEKGHDHSHG